MRKLSAVMVLLAAFALTGCNGVGLDDGVNLGPAVFGIVYDATTNQPLGGVRVDVANGTATTTQTGNYYVGQVPRGTHTLKASRDGYALYETDVMVTESMVEKKIYLSKQ